MINIRQAVADDIPKISELTTALSRRHIAPGCTAEGEALLLASMSYEATLERFRGPFRYFVAVFNLDLVGVIATREETHLFHLFVDEPHQNRGIGRALWLVAREACLGHGNPGRFTVNSSKEAQYFYESIGFEAQDEDCVNGVPFVPMVLLMTTTR